MKMLLKLGKLLLFLSNRLFYSQSIVIVNSLL